MRRSTKPLDIEELAKLQLRDRQTILEASRAIDVFRKRYGKPDKAFNTTQILRKTRDGRR